MNDIVKRLRGHGLKLEAALEIERLRDENELLHDEKGCRILDMRAEIERLRAAVRDQAGVELSEENDRLIAEIERLRADKAAISQTASDYLHEIERLHAALFRLSEDVAFTPMRASDMDEIKARLKYAHEALASTRAREILGN